MPRAMIAADAVLCYAILRSLPSRAAHDAAFAACRYAPRRRLMIAAAAMILRAAAIAYARRRVATR